MKLSRRECLAGIMILATSGCGGAGAGSSQVGATPSPNTAPPPPSDQGGSSTTPPINSFKPEDFGAVGDGRTNDTKAFAQMTAAVNAAGGGTIFLRPVTYIVGGHTTDPTGFWAYAPASIMDFNGCTDLTILGNGAHLKCADGLRYGTFDPATGLPTNHPPPYLGSGDLASPYKAMIEVKNCKGKVHIEKLELDGNLAGLLIGGERGGGGWQLPAFGLSLLNNVGEEYVIGVHTHHHAEDGLYIDGFPGRTASTTVQNLVSEYNGRQGCSIVGGCNYSFIDSHFNHSGRAVISSAPGAGFDIEAETNPIRNLTFTGCEFSNNSGCGLVADSGDSEGATFSDCQFVGTTAWSAWPNRPNFKFLGCRFVGAMCHAFGDGDPERATQFRKCTFSDDPELSPTKQVCGPGPIANLGDWDENVTFDGCTVNLKHDLTLPWTVHSVYNNCTMTQASQEYGYPRGTYTGVSQIVGVVSLYSSKIVGQLTVNGVVIPPTDFVPG